MAILNVKDFPDALYERLRARARAEGRSIAREVTHLLEAAVGQAEPCSILELEGLGAERWRGVEAVAHVQSERESWD